MPASLPAPVLKRVLRNAHSCVASTDEGVWVALVESVRLGRVLCSEEGVWLVLTRACGWYQAVVPHDRVREEQAEAQADHA
eukprot:2684599-Rhodomonas_salina.1